MSDDLYRVLYTDADGHEQLTAAMPLDAAYARARALEEQGHAVGSVMGDVAARGYMHARYAPAYRGVNIPPDLRADGVPYRVFEEWKRGVNSMLDMASVTPPAPDTTMSREAADFILRAVTGLLEDGGRPMAYAGYGPEVLDERDSDRALVRKAADVAGRDQIKNLELLGYLAELDADGEDGR